MLENLDHLVLGCRNLDEGIAHLEKLSGYRAAIGGAHPGRGTHNALLKMGPLSYLEIIAPDPQQRELTWFKQIAALPEPLLVGYAIRQDNLEDYAAALRQKGIACYGPVAGSRARPGGQLLRWRTLTYDDDRSGFLPFFIDWDSQSPHPSSDAPGALALLSFIRPSHLYEATVPAPGKHNALLPTHRARLRAKLTGLHGEFELVSGFTPSETSTA